MSISQEVRRLTAVNSSSSHRRNLGRVARVGFHGDSRTSGAGYTAAHARSPICAVAPLMNRLSDGRYVCVGLNADVNLEGSSFDAAAAYASFARGGKNIENTFGLLTAAIKAKVDILFLEGGYNSMPSTGSNITEVKGQQRMMVDLLLRNGVLPVLSTIYGPGSKSQTAIDDFSDFIRDLADEYSLPLIDVADVFQAAPATYYTPSESPQVHLSRAGARYLAVKRRLLLDQICDPRMAGVYPVIRDVVSTSAMAQELGIIYQNQFTATGAFSADGFSGTGPSGWTAQCYQLSGAGDQIAGGGTSVIGTASLAVAADPDQPTGNVLTYNHLTGAASYIRPADIALSGLASVGDILAVAGQIRTSGMEAGNTHFSVLLDQRNGGTPTQAHSTIYRTEADMGTWTAGDDSVDCGWGMFYQELKVVSTSTHVRCRFEMGQAVDTANASAGAYSGQIELKNLTILNLTTGGLYRPE